MSPFHCEFNINQSQYEQLALIIYHNRRYFIALSETNVLLNTSIQVQPPPQPYLCSMDRLVTSIVKENINGCFFSIFANFLYMHTLDTCSGWNRTAGSARLQEANSIENYQTIISY